MKNYISLNTFSGLSSILSAILIAVFCYLKYGLNVKYAPEIPSSNRLLEYARIYALMLGLVLGFASIVTGMVAKELDAIKKRLTDLESSKKL
jgi:uncharacterized membrane protein YfcA